MNGVKSGKLENCENDEETMSQSEEIVQINHKRSRETQS